MHDSGDSLKFNNLKRVFQVLGIALMLLAVGILAHLTSMTFLFLTDPGHISLLGWDMTQNWGFGGILAFVATLGGWGIWSMGDSQDLILPCAPNRRIGAPKEADVLVDIGETSPAPSACEAAIKVRPFEKREDAYGHWIGAQEYDCPESRTYARESCKQELLEKGKTLEGFSALLWEQRKEAIEILPFKLLKKYMPYLTDTNEQMAILVRLSDDIAFLRQVGASCMYANEIRIAALSSFAAPLEFTVLLDAQDRELRHVAIDHLAASGEYCDVLLKHLPNENDADLCRRIVEAIGVNASLGALAINPVSAAVAAILEACIDIPGLQRAVGAEGLDPTVSQKIEQRIRQLQKQEDEGGRLITDTQNEGTLFAVIENLRESRMVRIAATKDLGKLRPENQIEILPGLQPAWHCPACSGGGGCMKPPQWEDLTVRLARGAALASDSMECPQCSFTQTATDIILGKYDVITVIVTCLGCNTPMVGPIESWLGCQCRNCGDIVIEK